jgi:hypothetical protein
MVYKHGGQKRQHLTAPTKNWRFSASYDSFVVKPAFFKNNFSQPASGTFGFAPTHKADPSQSQKSHFFANAQGHNNKNE